MTTAFATHGTVDAFDDVALAVARINGEAYPRQVALGGSQSRWRATEDEILRASITVIWVALVVMIGVAASAIMTMG